MKRIDFAIQDRLISFLAARAGIAAPTTSLPAFLLFAAPASLPAAFRLHYPSTFLEE